MKKIFVCFVAFLMATGAYAQLSGGLKAGINLTSQKIEFMGESDSESGTGFHIGGYLNLGLGGALSLQPELMYNSLTVGSGDSKSTMNYLSVPVMVLYGFAEKFNVQVGPQLGLLLSTDPDQEDFEFITGTDFGINLGAGADFGKINVAFRYGLGLANIAGDDTKAIFQEFFGSDDVTYKTNNIQISVGYKLFGE